MLGADAYDWLVLTNILKFTIASALTVTGLGLYA